MGMETGVPGASRLVKTVGPPVPILTAPLEKPTIGMVDLPDQLPLPLPLEPGASIEHATTFSTTAIFDLDQYNGRSKFDLDVFSLLQVAGDVC